MTCLVGFVVSTPFRIIDGYNLMHAAGMARPRYGPGDLERCRNRFVRFVAANLSEEERARTTIVFDARDPHIDGPRETALDGVRILFAPATDDADAAIEQLIRQHSAPRQIELISSDRRLQTAIRRRRGTAVDSDAFARELDSRAERRPAEPAGEPEPPRDDPKFSGNVPESETEYWLRIFDDDAK